MTLDNPQYPAAAQAFMQGLYPPASANASGNTFRDPTAILANGTYVQGPLGGYKYPLIRTVGALDPQSIYLDGVTNCVSWALQAANTLNSPAAASLEESSRTMYENVGKAVENLSLPNRGGFNYFNAAEIWQYISYHYVHNATIKALFDAELFDGYLEQLRHYASLQQYYYNANISAAAANGEDVSLTETVRPVAGRTLAAKILGLFKNTITSSGTQTTLNLMVTEEAALVALFSLIGLTSKDPNFIGLPAQGSAAIFELLSIGDDGDEFPNTSDLWVRFYFLNGTQEGSLQAYSLFTNGPSQQNMRWSEFVQRMSTITISTVATWCDLCGDTSIFCPAFDYSDGSGLSTSGGSKKSGVSAPVAGVIGAVVTLAVVGIAMVLAGLLGGIRLHRNGRGMKSKLGGGFKGSKKLASDQDLVIPKAGAMPVEKGHERTGSWELRQGETGAKGGALRDVSVASPGVSPVVSPAVSPRHSLSADEIGVSPFAQPVRPDERV